MSINDMPLKNEERAVFALRSLYRKYGYMQYKMNKFEEYDLYVQNKDFLISDSVITFTDTNGKLMALKPDVTLSIIKNSRDRDTVLKVYYNENVYRVSSGSNCFREIMQTGIECIGNIDSYCIFEVLLLAAKSLESISTDCVLDISHMGIVSALLDSFELDGGSKRRIIECIGKKNLHEVSAICAGCGVPDDRTALLKELITTYGAPDSVLPQLKEKLSGAVPQEYFTLLETVTGMLKANGLGGLIRIDFSVISNASYYSGIVFKGFINGIATAVISGGQYDRLMQRMGRHSGAIGFAVYLDLLEELDCNTEQYDIDAVILYDENSSIQDLARAVDSISQSGRCVTAQRSVPLKLKYKQLLKLENGEVTVLENNA